MGKYVENGGRRYAWKASFAQAFQEPPSGFGAATVPSEVPCQPAVGSEEPPHVRRPTAGEHSYRPFVLIHNNIQKLSTFKWDTLL